MARKSEVTKLAQQILAARTLKKKATSKRAAEQRRAVRKGGKVLAPPPAILRYQKKTRPEHLRNAVLAGQKRPKSYSRPRASKSRKKMAPASSSSESDSDSSDDDEDSSSSDEDDDSSSDSEESESEESGQPPNASDDPGVLELEPPFTVLMLSKRFGGKTNTILNLVDPKEWDNIFVVTKSGHTGNLAVLTVKSMVRKSITDEWIEFLMEYQEKNNDKTLIVFDDFIGAGARKLKHSEWMDSLASTGRNFNISIWFSTQKLESVPTMIRANPDYILIGRMTETQIKNTTDELAMPNIGKDAFKKKLRDLAKRKDYEFLAIDEREDHFKIYKAPQLKLPKKAGAGAPTGQENQQTADAPAPTGKEAGP